MVGLLDMEGAGKAATWGTHVFGGYHQTDGASVPGWVIQLMLC